MYFLGEATSWLHFWSAFRFEELFQEFLRSCCANWSNLCIICTLFTVCHRSLSIYFIIFFHPIFIEIQQCKWINRIFVRCKLVIKIWDMKEVYFFNKIWMFWAKFWFIKSIKKTQVFGNRNYFWDILVAFSVILLHLLFYIDRYDHESRGINSLKGMCWFHNIR